MREIMFRSWLKKSKRMAYSFTVMYNPIKSEDDEHVIMQFTGLKDNQGKDIYEGDIVLITPFAGEDKTSYYGVVEWTPPAFLIKGPKNKNPFFNDYVPLEISFPVGYVCGIEVKGNIYQNEELLNKEE